MSGMTFGDALAALKHGAKVTREGWNGKGLWLELQVPDAHSKMTLPYIFLNYPVVLVENGREPKRVPWFASQTDMLGEDWQIADSRA